MAAAPAPFERYAQFRRYLGLGFHPRGDLCYTSDLSGQFNLWRQPVLPGGAPGYPTLLTGYHDQVVREFWFPADGKSVFFQSDPDGDENYQIYRLWPTEGTIEPITQAPKVQHELTAGPILSPGGELLYTDNGREATDVDVVVRNLKTGATVRPFPTGTAWGRPRFDPSFTRILALQSVGPSEDRTFVLDRKRGTTTEVAPHHGDGSVFPVDFTRDGRGVFVLSDLGSDFMHLDLYDLRRAKAVPLANPKQDIEYAVHSRKSRTLAYVANQEGYSSIHVGSAGGKFRRVAVPKGAIPPGIWGRQFEISDDGRFLAALWGSGTGPAELLWIPVRGGRPHYVTDGMIGGVPGAPLPPPQLVTIPSPGGRTVPGFLYLPKHPPKDPMPAVLSIHGGPHMQDRPDWRYAGLNGFLNSRGIAVLAPNVRGSSGYGKKYREALYRDWGGVDLEDFRACAEWLRQRPDIDPTRLAVYGGSFGGFAALECVARLPQYWKAGVDVFGPSNLITFLHGIPPSWRRVMERMLGDADRDRDFLLSRSPITYLDNVRADLLVIQGGKDPRVVRGESDQIVERLRAAGRRVEYTVFPDEGHGFSRHENQVKAMGEVARFLVAHLLPDDAPPAPRRPARS
jgi:dipeptidyl aminopeptidase/acylaminoacyl peptidase